MGSISKQDNGRYRARYRDPQGRTRSKSFELKADAERFLTSIDHRKLAGGYSEERVNDALDAMAETPRRAPMAHIGHLRHETARTSRANTR
jgi:hypothetical protein